MSECLIGSPFFNDPPQKQKLSYWSIAFLAVLLGLNGFMFFCIFDSGFGSDVIEQASVVGKTYTPERVTRELRNVKFHQYENVKHAPEWWVTAKTATWTWAMRVDQSDHARATTGERFDVLVNRGRWTGWRYTAKPCPPTEK